jgi:hypothetical protein
MNSVVTARGGSLATTPVLARIFATKPALVAVEVVFAVIGLLARASRAPVAQHREDIQSRCRASDIVSTMHRRLY